ncbi:CDP-diacylglycerol--glycerol-3-phosphate 3-phosphatidyltransferase [Sulfobacillus sp. hq2]|nr:CDP-diacylglycerol--glycerol-3-phosphate 3-phosphatidyltransferase [Sulfobacillus sp. hq2]
MRPVGGGANVNVADQVTLSRIILTPVVVALWLAHAPKWHWIGLVVFIIAGMTDFVDGRLARHASKTTHFGAYMDPLADKILVLGSGLALIASNRLSVWIVLILLLREFAITGLRSILPAGTTMGASAVAKWKTTGQLFALGASAVLTGMVPIVFWVVALTLTIWSGIEYFYRYWPRA